MKTSTAEGHAGPDHQRDGTGLDRDSDSTPRQNLTPDDEPHQAGDHERESQNGMPSQRAGRRLIHNR
jgi:hypothetical protein